MITVISPIYNEESNLLELKRRLVLALESTDEEFEILLIENGSFDNSLQVIQSMRAQDPRVKYLSLSRNFGHQGGIWAGMTYATGDAIISLDGDLQHPPEMIPEMIRLWKQGYDVVYTVKKGRADHDNWRFIPSAVFYRIMNKFTDVKLSYGQSDFRLVDKKVRDVLVSIPEKNKFLRGMVEWVGFKQIEMKYATEPRKYGKSKFRLRNYINFAIDGIFSFSILPLRVFLWAGLFISLVCSIYAVFLVVLYALHALGNEAVTLPAGWTTITVGLIFFGSIQLMGIGLLGEYIGRIYSQVKQRPDFIVRQKEVE